MERPGVATRHVGDTAPEGDVLGREVRLVDHTADGELAARAGGDPDAPVRERGRRRGRRSRASGSKRVEAESTSTTATCSDALPSPTHSRSPRGVDRQVPRPARQAHAPDHDTAHHVDCDDAASARVGDEGMPAVGVRRGVARFDETAEHVRTAMPVDDRDRADRGMADDRALADELDRARVGQRRDRAHDAVGAEVDDGEPLLGVAGDERRTARPRGPRAGRTAPRRRAGRTHGGSREWLRRGRTREVPGR